MKNVINTESVQFSFTEIRFDDPANAMLVAVDKTDGSITFTSKMVKREFEAMIVSAMNAAVSTEFMINLLKAVLNSPIADDLLKSSVMIDIDKQRGVAQ